MTVRTYVDLERDFRSRNERRLRTAEWLQAAAGTDDARHRNDLLQHVVLANLAISHAVARRYFGRGVSEEDLLQVAHTALVQAARAFRPDRGCEFAGFAVPTITGAIRHYFRDSCWVVRPPRRVQDLQPAVSRASEEITARTGEPATTRELSDALEVSERSILDALAARGCFTPESLDKSAPDASEAALGDFLGADEPGYASAEARLDLRRAVAELDDEDKSLLHLRFYEDLTQQEIADRRGTSQANVSRALGRVLRRLCASMSLDHV